MSDSTSEGASAPGPTYAQPLTATTGLQSYALSGGTGGAHSLAQRDERVLARGTKRTRLNQHRRHGRPSSRPEDYAAMKLFPQMLATLHKSVFDINAAAPENRDELVKISFDEFEAAIAPELAKAVEESTDEALEKLTPEIVAEIEEPLFKGLGCVGRVANLMSRLAEQVQQITEGKNYSGSSEVMDPASDQVAALLEHMLQIGELALRASVNEHVEPADDGEEMDDDLSYVSVPNAEDPSEDASMVLKTVLPMELAKFACDPASLTMAAVEHGSSLLLLAGVSEDTLGKLFGLGADVDVLRKDAGMGAPDDGWDPSQAQGTDPNDLVAQVEILGRIAAASLMQVDHVMTLLGAQGGDDGSSMGQDPGTDPNADGSTDPGAEAAPPPAQADGSTAADDETAEPTAAADAGPDTTGGAAAPDDGTDPKKKPFGKAAMGTGLAKVVGAAARPSDPEVTAMRAQLATMEAKLAKQAGESAEVAALTRRVEQLSRQPAPAKGIVQATGLSKSADNGGEPNDELAKLANDIDRARTPEDKRRLLLKAAIKFPGMNLSELQKAE